MPNPRRREDPVFSLDKAAIRRARARPKLSSMESRVIIFLPIILGLMVWTIYDYRDRIADAQTAAYNPIPESAKLSPMARPLFDKLPALPTEAALAAEREAAATLVANGLPVPLTSDGLDAIAVAWAEARLEADAKLAPMPQRLAAADLVLADHVRLGTPLIVEGRLEDRLPAPVEGSSRPWQRLLVELDAGQFVEVLSPVREAAEAVIGEQVRIAGRLLTYVRHPVEGGEVTLPVLVGRSVLPSAAPRTETDALAEFHRPWSMPHDLYDEVDDLRLWTETRPYYHLLGQVLRDRSTAGVYDGVADGNQMADDVHLRPADFRGTPFTITGYVYMAWEDPDVARDKPFGVGRVVRMLLWKRDFAPLTETIDGVDRQSMKLVLRLYELAAITEQEIPVKGTMVQATGRFLKKRAVAVQPNERRDKLNNVVRQSDRVYTWMYVTGEWTELEGPRSYQFGPVAWGVTIGVVVMMLGGVVLWWKEVRHHGRRMQGAANRVREQRRGLMQRRAAQDPPPGAPPADPSPSDGGGQAPPPT